MLDSGRVSAVKLKLRDVKTGQESLLLVTKMNLKGLLVQTAHALPLGTPVRLSLQLEDGTPPLELGGEIYKIAEKAGGQKGMIVRFVRPSKAVLDRVTGYLASKEVDLLTESKSHSAGSLDAKTMLATEPLPAPPPLPKPKTESKASKRKREIRISSTVDEEEAQSEAPSFAEETRFMAQAEHASVGRRKVRKTWLKTAVRLLSITALGAGIVTVGAVVGPRFRTYLQERGKVSPPTGWPSPAAQPAVEPTDEPSVEQEPARAAPLAVAQPERPTVTPKPLPPELKKITVEDLVGFLKVNLEGPGLVRAEVSRLKSPRRLLVELPGVRNFSAPALTDVGLNPLARIRVSRKADSRVQVTLDLYPGGFPRYEVKELPTGLTLYLHR